MNRLSFEEKIFNKELNYEIKGFPKPEVMKILRRKEKNKDGTYKNMKNILPGMQYRPDIVSAYYYGNPNLSWIIDFANNFTNGIKDYYPGREILVPDLDETFSLLSSHIES